jgi:hypothetical protein
MSRSPNPRNRVLAGLAIVALPALLPLAGCGDTGTVPPIAGRRGADPAQKVRPGLDPAKINSPSATPGEPGKPAPGRGRALD